MSEITEKALTKITEKQSQYNENDKHYWIAEQVKDIAAESDDNAQHIFNDLDDDKMSLKEIEKKIAEYAKTHGGCTPPKAADKIIRDFFGLAELAKKLSMSSAEVTEFKTAFEQVQTWNRKCLNIIGRIENPETAAKLKTAMQTFLAQALETVKGE